MHHFVAKVVVAAIIITLAGVASATQARADSSYLFTGAWFNDYAAIAITRGHDKPLYGPSPWVHKKEKSRHAHRHHFERDKPKTGLSRKRIGSRDQTRGLRTHASGYSW